MRTMWQGLVKRRRPWLAAGMGALCLCLLLGTSEAAAQCAMCRTALEGADPAQVRLAEGFYYSILILFAMPFSIVGVVGGLIYRGYRRNRQAHTRPVR